MLATAEREYTMSNQFRPSTGNLEAHDYTDHVNFVETSHLVGPLGQPAASMSIGELDEWYNDRMRNVSPADKRIIESGGDFSDAHFIADLQRLHRYIVWRKEGVLIAEGGLMHYRV